MKFVHLTDPHMVAPGHRLYTIDPCERLIQAVSDINARQHDAEFALITGDLTHWGQADAYRALRRILDGLAMPIRMLIGNHDDRRVFLQHFPRTPTDRHGFVQYAFQASAGVFLMLDSTEPGAHDGELCDRRLSWLQEQLDTYRGSDLFIALHHPPVRSGIAGIDAVGLRRPELLWQCLKDTERLRHIFFGHVHRPVSGSWHGVPFSTLRGTAHQLAADFDGRAGRALTMCLEPPAYAVVQVDEVSVVVHQHDYLDRSARFEHLETPDGQVSDLSKLTA